MFRVQVVGVIPVDPTDQGHQEAAGTGELIDPDQLLFEGAHEALLVGVGFGIRVVGDDLPGFFGPLNS